MNIIQSFQNRVRRAFSEAALQYEALTSLHNEIARELVKKVMATEDCRHILDVGTGTGRMARCASFYFPESKVTGLDIAEGMLAVARREKEGVGYVQGDAQALPFADDTFQLVLSNLAYQWVPDLTGAFQEARRVLSPDGRFCATLFGRNTFKEMFAGLEMGAAELNLPPVSFRRLPSLEGAEGALRTAGFANVRTDYEYIKVGFNDLWDLLRWLKNIGANQLPRDAFIGKDLLTAANTYCLKTFPYHNGIGVTFEVIWLEADGMSG